MHLGVNTLFHVPGDVGGTETYLKESLLAIASKFPDVWMTLFTNDDNDNTIREWLSESSTCKYYRIPVRSRVRPLRIVAEQLLLPWYIRKSGVEVLWSPGYTAPYYAACPQVVTIHDLQYKAFPEDMVWLERITLDRLVRIACKRCAGIITVSEFSRRQVIHYGFAAPEKIQAVFEGVDPLFGEMEHNDSTVEELASFMSKDAPFILCVAHSYPHKNIDLLVKAFRRVMGEIPHNLLLVGKARLGERELERAIRTVKPGNRLFRLYGGISSAALRLLYQKADLFVLPSSYEGFGLPILEAMMAGTPVICSREASLPEVGGKCAFYVDPMSVTTLAEQIIHTLNLPNQEKDEWLDSARQWAESFTWQKSAHQTLSVLRTCLSSRA